jgi:uncharacterized protein (UPF0212 family)
VSLRKCPDCGNDVSSSAPACPHCGRPRKKSGLTIEIVGGLSLAAICVVIRALNSVSHDEATRDSVAPTGPRETLVARPYRQLDSGLTAFVGYNRTLHVFRIENRDTFPWTDCQLSLNSHGLSGYELAVETIKPGLTDAALLQSAGFSDPDGNRFDTSTDQVATLDLDCETPLGRRLYWGKFATEIARR